MSEPKDKPKETTKHTGDKPVTREKPVLKEEPVVGNPDNSKTPSKKEEE